MHELIQYSSNKCMICIWSELYRRSFEGELLTFENVIYTHKLIQKLKKIEFWMKNCNKNKELTVSFVQSPITPTTTCCYVCCFVNNNNLSMNFEFNSFFFVYFCKTIRNLIVNLSRKTHLSSIKHLFFWLGRRLCYNRDKGNRMPFNILIWEKVPKLIYYANKFWPKRNFMGPGFVTSAGSYSRMLFLIRYEISPWISLSHIFSCLWFFDRSERKKYY